MDKVAKQITKELEEVRERIWVLQKRSKRSYEQIADDMGISRNWLADFANRPSENPLHNNFRRVQIYFENLEEA